LLNGAVGTLAGNKKAELLGIGYCFVNSEWVLSAYWDSDIANSEAGLAVLRLGGGLERTLLISDMKRMILVFVFGCEKRR